MKKIVLILGLCLNVCACMQTDNFTQKQEFVNPVFNKLLLAYGRTSWNTLLTPTSVTISPDNFSNPDAYIEKYDCQLLENEQDHIKYDCIICNPYLVKVGLATKNCYPNTIIYQIADDGLVRKLSFKPSKYEPFSIMHLKPEP